MPRRAETALVAGVRLRALRLVTWGRVGETAESGSLPQPTARLRLGFLAPAVADYRARWVPWRASSRTRWWEPFEHPADGITRLVESCVDSEAAALLGIRRVPTRHTARRSSSA